MSTNITAVEPNKLHSLILSIIGFILIKKVVYFLLSYILDMVFMYAKEYQRCQIHLRSLPIISTTTQLAHAKATDIPSEYFFYNVPISGEKVKDPLNRLKEDRYVFIDIREEVPSHFRLFTPDRFSKLKPIFLDYWSVNKWLSPAVIVSELKALNEIPLTFTHNNYTNLAPLVLSKNNVNLNLHTDKIVNNYLYTIGEFSNIRIKAYAFKDSAYVSFRAMVSNKGVEILPLYPSNPEILFYINKPHNTYNQDIANISKEHILGIKSTYFKGGIFEFLHTVDIFNHPIKIVNVAIILVVLWLVWINYIASITAILKAIAEKFINRTIKTWIKDSTPNVTRLGTDWADSEDEGENNAPSLKSKI